MHLQENSIFDLDLGVKITWNVAQYPLHYVTYSATKFESATSNGLGGDTFTRNVTDRSIEGQQTNFCTKIFLKKKAGIMNRNIKENSSNNVASLSSVCSFAKKNLLKLIKMAPYNSQKQV